MTDKDYMKHIRSKLHLNQTEMAELLGYNSQDAISKIETGERQMSNIARKFLEYIEEKELK